MNARDRRSSLAAERTSAGVFPSGPRCPFSPLPPRKERGLLSADLRHSFTTIRAYGSAKHCPCLKFTTTAKGGSGTAAAAPVPQAWCPTLGLIRAESLEALLPQVRAHECMKKEGHADVPAVRPQKTQQPGYSSPHPCRWTAAAFGETTPPSMPGNSLKRSNPLAHQYV